MASRLTVLYDYLHGLSVENLACLLENDHANGLRGHFHGLSVAQVLFALSPSATSAGLADHSRVHMLGCRKLTCLSQVDIRKLSPDGGMKLISHKVFFKSFCRSQVPHNSVNSSFTISNIKNKLTDSCGN